MDGKQPHWKDALNKLAMYNVLIIMTLAGIASAPMALEVSILRRTLKTSFSHTARNLKLWLEIAERPSCCRSTGLPRDC